MDKIKSKKRAKVKSKVGSFRKDISTEKKMAVASTDSAAEISECLKKLCQRICHNKRIEERAYRMAVATLNAAGNNVSCTDEELLCRRIREKLQTAHSVRHSDTFTRYYHQIKISSQTILKNRSSLLEFLWALSGEQSSNKASGVACVDNTMQAPSWTKVPPLPQIHSSSHVNLPASVPSSASLSSSTHSSERKFSGDLGERECVQNVVYAAQGIVGNMILNSNERGARGRQLLAQRLSELGFLHHTIVKYMDPDSGCMPIGLVGEGLVSAFRNELTEYYRSVAILQSQINSGESELTLRRLSVWALEPLHRLQWLAIIGNAAQHKKGGELATCVHRFLSHGDQRVTGLVGQILSTVCYPLYVMLCRWLLDGEIDDPHNEFFIESRTSVSIERLWHDKYRVRESMLPAFISYEHAQKLLAAGKSITFLREVCGERGPLNERDHLKRVLDNSSVELLFSGGPCLQELMSSAYLGVSRRLLDALVGPHKVMQHLAALRSYLLLQQGDFIQMLMQLLEPELNKNASQLYVLNLTCVLEAAIRATNAQYHDPDTLNRLYVNMFPPSAEDTGWDVFSLFYRVEGPLGTVLEPDAAARYRSLFSHLWKAKRMEHTLARMWRDHITGARGCGRNYIREVEPLLRRLHTLRSEMTHLVKELQYAVFVVVECAWRALQNDASRAHALDELLAAHHRFLDTLTAGCLLDTNTKKLQSYLGNVYNEILTLREFERKLYLRIDQEIERRKSIELLKEERTGRGEFGSTTAEEMKYKQEYEIFKQYLTQGKADLNVLARTYRGHVKALILQLALQNESNLQFLLFRLDYNDFYKRGDSKLHEPLTYQHKRLSGAGISSFKGRSVQRLQANT